MSSTWIEFNKKVECWFRIVCVVLRKWWWHFSLSAQFSLPLSFTAFLLVPCSFLLTIVILQCESWYVSHFFKKDATFFFKKDYLLFANYITVKDPLRGFIKPTTGSMPRDEPSLLYYIIITRNQRSALFSHNFYSTLCEVKCIEIASHIEFCVLYKRYIRFLSIW